ncbi:MULTISPECIES: hypothetical protein [Bacillaceae]|uniref:hypothetical protein n=2 Tax=Bacillaceae TaxID=186817 RepID=UPI0011555835|nr:MULTISPECIES: hypothetical protein [Bacillaceae]
MNTFFTILGVGSLFLFHHMDITLSDAIMLMTIILSSLYIMICNELIVYQKDVKPIKHHGTNEPYPALPSNLLYDCTEVSVVSK